MEWKLVLFLAAPFLTCQAATLGLSMIRKSLSKARERAPEQAVKASMPRT